MSSVRISEAQLCEVFERAISDGLWSRTYPRLIHIVKEMNALQGRPDLVATHHDVSRLEGGPWDVLAQTLTKPSRARLVSLLKPGSPRTFEYLLTKSGYSKAVVSRTLADLQARGLIRTCNGSGYLLATDFPSSFPELWAFELKVDHWRRALYQALQYQSFAHRVAVILPLSTVRRAESHLDAFTTFRLGLMAVSEDGKEFRTIVPPKRNRPSSSFQRLHAIGQFISAMKLKYADSSAAAR